MQIGLVAIAVLIILVGLILTISPIPFGAVIVVAGLSMLVAVSPHVRALLRLERRRHPHIDRFLGEAEEKVPHVIAAPLERTDGPEARALHIRHGHDCSRNPKRAANARAAEAQAVKADRANDNAP